MGGSGGGSSNTQASIAPELRPLYKETGQRILDYQRGTPTGGIAPFADANPMDIAGKSNLQGRSFDQLGRMFDEAQQPLENAPTIQAGRRYFESSIAPKIGNEAALSGLGRSTALTNALASTEAETLLPLLMDEQGRRDRLVGMGLEAGGVERGIEQDTNTAEYQDFLRRQALQEQSLFGPLSQLPSTFGQSTKTSSGGGGLFK